MTPNTPGDPQKGKPAEEEQAEQEAAEAKEATAQEAAAEAAEPAPPADADADADAEPGTPLAEGTAADVTGVGKDIAAAAIAEGTSEPVEAAAPADEPVAEAPDADADVEAAEDIPEPEAAAAEAETESDLAKTDEPEPDASAEAAADAADAADTEAPGRRRRGRRGRRGRGGDAETAPAAPTPAPQRRAPARAKGELVVVRAQAKYVRSSARKARLVCDHIRGKSVQEARAILAHTPRAVARDWSKLLESAIANAEHNHELVGDDLRVHSVHADEGPTLKRFRPRAMGRATRIRKRTSHLTITLTPKE
jgi:ribosomal protein L22